MNEALSIDGYSQNGSAVNTNSYPLRPNARILIEIDGNNILNDGIIIDGNNISVRGVIINRVAQHGVTIYDSANNVTISGCYIGSDYSGENARPNGENGIVRFNTDAGSDITIGGDTNADRNLLSFNAQAGFAGGNITGLIVQGNWFEANTVAGLGSGDSSDALIDKNVIFNSGFAGMAVDSGTPVSGITITSNIVYDNGQIGVRLSGGNDVTIGSPSSGNRIWGHSVNLNIAGIEGLASLDGVVVQSNIIGTSSAFGVYESVTQGVGVSIAGNPRNVLIGGSNSGEGNIVVGNSGLGVGVSTYNINGYNVSAVPDKISILGNSISNTTAAPVTGFPAEGLGIDLFATTDTSDPPDFNIDVLDDMGVTMNDLGDTDQGSNGYINFPEIKSIEYAPGSLGIRFDLDALDSPTNQYRLEFFASDSADASGYGEGQIYLGALTVANGLNQQGAITVNDSMDLSGKFITATTTAVDSTTNSGFGSTSEFSRAAQISGITNQSADLAATGINYDYLWTGGITIVLVSAIILARYHKYSKNHFTALNS